MRRTFPAYVPQCSKVNKSKPETNWNDKQEGKVRDKEKICLRKEIKTDHAQLSFGPTATLRRAGAPRRANSAETTKRRPRGSPGPSPLDAATDRAMSPGLQGPGTPRPDGWPAGASRAPTAAAIAGGPPAG